MNTIPQLLRAMQASHPDLAAQYYRESKASPFVSRSFADFYQDALDFGAGLLSLGVKPAEPVGLLSDNRREWTVADVGIQSCGAADVPRGRDITDGEIAIIYGVTSCRVHRRRARRRACPPRGAERRASRASRGHRHGGRRPMLLPRPASGRFPFPRLSSWAARIAPRIPGRSRHWSSGAARRISPRSSSPRGRRGGPRACRSPRRTTFYTPRAARSA